MSSPREEDASAAEVVERLLTVTHGIRRRHNAELASYELSVPRGRLLMAMHQLGQPKMSELAASLDLNARTITTAVDTLEREGILERRPDPTDRRATRVLLTVAGRAQIAEWQEFQRRLAESALAPLSAGERRSLMTLLDKIRDGLGSLDAVRGPADGTSAGPRPGGRAGGP
ncbi:MAG TPA: MarR family transcriptional regulator [Candidatus Dormibacteraeota bacterium]|nr:MarR family transcriptional regulator [Candidatus Dormibacteraeota bacterium]